MTRLAWRPIRSYGVGSGSLFGVWFGGRFAFQATVIRLNH